MTYFPTFLAVPIQRCGASGTINAIPVVDYVMGSQSSSLVDRSRKLVMGQELNIMVSMVLTADGNRIKNAIKKKISAHEGTLYTRAITFDARVLEGLELSNIWIAVSTVNAVLGILCQLYVFYILRRHYFLSKRSIKLDYCYCALFTATVGNVCVTIGSYDTFGLRGAILSTWGIQLYITHFYCVIFSFGFCLLMWEEAVVMIISSLRMKMKTLSLRRRIGAIILFLSSAVLENTLLYLQACGYFPFDVLNSSFIMNTLMLVLQVGHMLSASRRALRALHQIDNKVSASQAPRSEVGRVQTSVGGGGVGGGGGAEVKPPLLTPMVAKQKSKDGGVSSSAVTVAAQGHGGAGGQLQAIYDALRKKLMRFIYLKLRCLVIIVWILVHMLLVYWKVHLQSIVAFCLLSNGFSTVFIVLQIGCLRTLSIASESRN